MQYIHTRTYVDIDFPQPVGIIHILSARNLVDNFLRFTRTSFMYIRCTSTDVCLTVEFYTVLHNLILTSQRGNISHSLFNIPRWHVYNFLFLFFCI